METTEGTSEGRVMWILKTYQLLNLRGLIWDDLMDVLIRTNGPSQGKRNDWSCPGSAP
jgi:hypothetical protein